MFNRLRYAPLVAAVPGCAALLLAVQDLSHFSFQGFTSQILRDDLSLAIEEESRRDAADAVLARQLVSPAFAVEVLLPGHLLRLHEGS